MRDWILYYHDQLRFTQAAASVLRHSRKREPGFAADESLWAGASCTAGKASCQRPSEYERHRISVYSSPGWRDLLSGYRGKGEGRSSMDPSTGELSEKAFIRP